MASIHQSQRFLPNTVTPPHLSQGYHSGFLRPHSTAFPLTRVFAPLPFGMPSLVRPHPIILSSHTPLYSHTPLRYRFQSPCQPHSLWRMFFPRTLDQHIQHHLPLNSGQLCISIPPLSSPSQPSSPWCLLMGQPSPSHSFRHTFIYLF